MDSVVDCFDVDIDVVDKVDEEVLIDLVASVVIFYHNDS